MPLFSGLVWKILFDPEVNKAIVFFGVNNPHLSVKEITDQGLVLCPEQGPDFCSDQGWLFRHRKDPAKGYLYCCSYQEASRAISWLPVLDDPQILTNDDSSRVPAKSRSQRQRPVRENSEGTENLCQISIASNSGVKWPPLFYDAVGDIIFPTKVILSGDNEFPNDSTDNTFGDDIVDSNVTADNLIDSAASVAVIVVNEKVISVACPGSKLKLTDEVQSQFRCVDDALIRVDQPSGEPVQYSDLSCTKSIEEDLLPGNNSCGPPDQPGELL